MTRPSSRTSFSSAGGSGSPRAARATSTRCGRCTRTRRDVEGGGLFDERRGLWWRDASFSPGDVHTLSPNGSEILLVARERLGARGSGARAGGAARGRSRTARRMRPTSVRSPQRSSPSSAKTASGTPAWPTRPIARPRANRAKMAPRRAAPPCSRTGSPGYSPWPARRGEVRGLPCSPPTTACRAAPCVATASSVGCNPRAPRRARARDRSGADVVPNFEDFGVGCFLLAGSEVLRLGRGSPLND